jgi:phosphotransferase system IIB component
VRAFGGPGNVQKAEHVAVTRLRFVLRDTGRADEEAVKSAGAGSVIKASENVWHVIAGERAPAIAAAVKLHLNAPLDTATPVA